MPERPQDEIDKVVTEARKSGKPFVVTVHYPNERGEGQADPFHFTVKETVTSGPYTLAKVHYPDSVNYEGMKILLLRTPAGGISKLKGLDPHFLQDKNNGLLARFEPTESGWLMGMMVLRSLPKL